MYVRARIASLFLLAGSGLASQVRRYNFTITLQWNSMDGHGRPVFMMNGQSPGPLIEAEEGDEIEVFVDNQLAAETTMHWYASYEEKSKFTSIDRKIGTVYTRSTDHGTMECLESRSTPCSLVIRTPIDLLFSSSMEVTSTMAISGQPLLTACEGPFGLHLQRGVRGLTS